MPRRKGALFLPLDVHFPSDPKILRAGEAAGWLYLHMCLASKARGTDGVLERVEIANLGVKSWRSRLDRLVINDLIVPWGDDSYAIVAWFGHNDPHNEVVDRRMSDAERKRQARAAERETAKRPSPVRTDKGTASVPRPDGQVSDVRTESVPRPNVEKREEEKRKEEVDVTTDDAHARASSWAES